MIVRLIRTSIFIFTLFLLSCSDSDRKKEAVQKQQVGAGSQRPPVRAEAITVSTTTLLDNIEIPGTVVANETTEIQRNFCKATRY